MKKLGWIKVKQKIEYLPKLESYPGVNKTYQTVWTVEVIQSWTKCFHVYISFLMTYHFLSLRVFLCCTVVPFLSVCLSVCLFFGQSAYRVLSNDVLKRKTQTFVVGALLCFFALHANVRLNATTCSCKSWKSWKRKKNLEKVGNVAAATAAAPPFSGVDSNRQNVF